MLDIFFSIQSFFIRTSVRTVFDRFLANLHNVGIMLGFRLLPKLRRSYNKKVEHGHNTMVHEDHEFVKQITYGIYWYSAVGY